MANETSTTRVRVRTTQENGRRRARFHITREWQFLDVTAEELAALEGDPAIAVVPAKPGDEEKLAAAKLAMDPMGIDPHDKDLVRANRRERIARFGYDPEEDVIHPLGNNLGVPTTTVPDTSASAIAKRREEDRKLGQLQRTAQPAIPVKIVSEEETTSTDSSTDGGDGTSSETTETSDTPPRGRRNR